MVVQRVVLVISFLLVASMGVSGLRSGAHNSYALRVRLSTRLRATAGNPGMQGGEEKPMMGFEGGIVGSSKDSGDIPEEIRIANLPKMANGLQKSLRKLVGELLSSKAVETTSHYMKEFRNDADQRWMSSYKGYNENSFSAVFPGREDSQWTDWFESMIKSDKMEIQVLMSAPKGSIFGSRSMRGRKIPKEKAEDDGGDETFVGGDEKGEEFDISDSGLRVEYMHNLEPRKIANQLLVVRESITKEVLMDLPCIRLECIEAVRYATVKVEQSEEDAIKTMKMTRSATMGTDSTPLRDRTYHDLSVIASNFALQMVYNSGNDATKTYLDAFLAELGTEEEKRTVAERLLHEHAAPVEMLEELHYRGLHQGLTSIEDQTQEERKVNILKISQTLLDCRYAVSLEIKKIVMEDDSRTRQ